MVDAGDTGLERLRAHTLGLLLIRRCKLGVAAADFNGEPLASCQPLVVSDNDSQIFELVHGARPTQGTTPPRVGNSRQPRRRPLPDTAASRRLIKDKAKARGMRTASFVGRP